MLAVETRGLRKSFGGGDGKVWALKGIDLKIAKSQVFGLLGPNGAGKSTLIYILSTMLLPTSGKASVMGFDVAAQEREARSITGICMSGSHFHRDMTPREVLKYYGLMMGISRQKRERRANELVERLGISWFQHKQMGCLSTGMKQKVGIAKSLLNEPQLLLLDEPTAGLDVEVALSIRDFILDLLDEREMTVILTSHHLQEVEEMCKRIAIINNGQIAAEGNIREIKRGLRIPDIIHLYLNRYGGLGFLEGLNGVKSISVSDGVFIQVDSGLKRLDTISRALKSHGFVINDLEIEKASLEDVFLSVIEDRHSSVEYRIGRGERRV